MIDSDELNVIYAEPVNEVLTREITYSDKNYIKAEPTGKMILKYSMSTSTNRSDG